MASILRAFSVTELVNVDSNDDRLKAILRWNFATFKDRLENQFDWRATPSFSWEAVIAAIQQSADEAMQLYQQWQWLTSKHGQDLYKWMMIVLFYNLDTTDYQVIAKILLTSYDFNLRSRMLAGAAVFERTMEQVGELMRSADDEGGDEDEDAYELFHKKLNDFQHLMLNPQLYAESARTTELPVLVTATGVSVVELSSSVIAAGQPGLTAQQPAAYTINRSMSQRKRRRMGQLDETSME